MGGFFYCWRAVSCLAIEQTLVSFSSIDGSHFLDMTFVQAPSQPACRGGVFLGYDEQGGKAKAENLAAVHPVYRFARLAVRNEGKGNEGKEEEGEE